MSSHDQTKIDGNGIQIPLNITPDQIGRFVGNKGNSIRKFVIGRAIASYKEQNPTDVNIPLRIQVVKSEDNSSVEAVVEVGKDHDGLIPHIESSIKNHEEIFLKNIAKASSKPKICRLVFKTKMEHFMIGKYVGGGGKNIAEVCRDCQDAIKSFSDETVRLSINPDKRINMKSVGKFFYIKNNLNTDQNVLITVSLKYSRDPDIFFRAVKNIMIKSVTSMFEEKQESSHEVDFLGGGSCNFDLTFNPGENFDDDDECIDNPSSPGYCPNSPNYSPNSPNSPCYDPNSS